jgi:hypothetical protein
MMLLGVLIAVSASAAPNDAIRRQAAICGLKTEQLVWTKDAEGHVRSSITAPGDLDTLSFKSMRCLLVWAQKSGGRIGFVSAPPIVAKDNSPTTRAAHTPASHPDTTAHDRRVVQEWQRYLLRRRQFLMDQLRYAAKHQSRLEEVTNGKRTDVSADWLDSIQNEFGEVTKLLIDAGLVTEAQAKADATR